MNETVNELPVLATVTDVHFHGYHTDDELPLMINQSFPSVDRLSFKCKTRENAEKVRKVLLPLLAKPFECKTEITGELVMMLPKTVP